MFMKRALDEYARRTTKDPIRYQNNIQRKVVNTKPTTILDRQQLI